MKAIQIGKRIRHCRKAGGLSQQQLAILAGVGKTVIFDIEKGKKTIRLDTLLKIFNALNIKMNLILPIPYSGESKT